MNNNNQTKCGTALFLGVPNAGKSSLLNSILKIKISAVSHKPNMTRFCVTGVHTDGNSQVILMDAPGLLEKPKNTLETKMQTHLKQAMRDVDMVVAVVDVQSAMHQREQRLYDMIVKYSKPAILALNKIDTIKKADLLPLLSEYNEKYNFWRAIVPISAQKNNGIDRLLTEINNLLPQAPWQYAPDDLSTMPIKLLATEATREQIYKRLHDELPYHIHVTADEWTNKKDGSVTVRQNIIVDADRYRRIILGHKGETIKAIGQDARATISRIIDQPVHLFLTVTVQENWQDDITHAS